MNRPSASQSSPGLPVAPKSSGWTRRGRLPSRPGFARGFTLIEALVTIGIVSILVALAVPSFRDTIASRRVSASVSAFSSSLRLARSEAIKRGIEVTVCRGTVVSGTPTCSNGTDWSVGWLVFADRGTANTFNTGDVLVRAEEAPASANGIVSDSATPIRFLRTGIAPSAGDRTMLFRPQVPTTSPSYARLTQTVCVNSTGGTRLISGVGTCP